MDVDSLTDELAETMGRGGGFMFTNKVDDGDNDSEGPMSTTYKGCIPVASL